MIEHKVYVSSHCKEPQISTDMADTRYRTDGVRHIVVFKKQSSHPINPMPIFVSPNNKQIHLEAISEFIHQICLQTIIPCC